MNAWIATRPLKNANAPLTPFAMPQYKLAATAEVEAARRRGGVVRGVGAPQHPALDELRALRRALRGRALLRRHLDEVRLSARARCVLAIGSVVFLGTLAWLATFPVSLSV